MYNEISVVSMPANTTCILQPTDQGEILTFKSCYVRNTFCKAIAAVDNDSSHGHERSEPKIFRKRFPMLDAFTAHSMLHSRRLKYQH